MIFREKEGSSELLNHEDLLEETVHVANATEVPESCVSCGGLKPVTVSDGPVFELSASPKGINMQLTKLCEKLT